MVEMSTTVYENALELRNESWQNAEIPSWVALESVGLDQYFTKSDVAKRCFKKAVKHLESQGISIENCLFIEPSAGTGSFFDLLPREQRIGLDVLPLCDGVIEQDFLTWACPESDKTIVYIGNPPFGYRGWLALSFINKCAQNADYVFFLLPMSFQSIGKGSPRRRVKGLNLISYEIIESDGYTLLDGSDASINTIWTVWEKGTNYIPEPPDVSEYVDLFTVDMRKERLCGQTRLHDADFFLQRTFYSDPPNPVNSFEDVKYVCGYGFITKNNSLNRVKDILRQTDWLKYCNLATHNCHHISMCHIQQALFDGGLTSV